MTGTTLAHMTFEEFERLPDSPGKLELLRGELIDLPPARLKHADIVHRVYERLKILLAEARARGQAGDLGKVYMETGYRMGARSWLQPDVSITHACQQADDYYVGSPALVVEVISDEKTADHVDGKIEEYSRNGAREIWVVYPARKHVWVYTSGAAAEMRSGEFRADLLGGGAIDLDEILK
ncbi:MAG TPA: Uma2 family endonuclease [Bryobacteraceae bacterium]|nr:Uma2 family endonuclease [Bryobacteraceae bacterium]